MTIELEADPTVSPTEKTDGPAVEVVISPPDGAQKQANDKELAVEVGGEHCSNQSQPLGEVGIEVTSDSVEVTARNGGYISTPYRRPWRLPRWG